MGFCTVDDTEDVAAKEEDVEEETEIPPLVEPPRETSEAIEQIKKLCRVCSSNGLISISAYPNVAELKVNTTRFRDHPEWTSVTIADIIGQISGTSVIFLFLHFVMKFLKKFSFRSLLTTRSRSSYASTAFCTCNTPTRYDFRSDRAPRTCCKRNGSQMTTRWGWRLANSTSGGLQRGKSRKLTPKPKRNSTSTTLSRTQTSRLRRTSSSRQREPSSRSVRPARNVSCPSRASTTTWSCARSASSTLSSRHSGPSTRGDWRVR